MMLGTVIAIDGDYAVQPTGAHDAYQKGDKVKFEDFSYEKL